MDIHARTCEWCQATNHAASDLRGKKLGKHERRVLLAAGSPGGSSTPIVPPGPSQTDQTATRRAVDTLREAGLIIVAADKARIYPGDPDADAVLRHLNRKRAVLRFARRTELGEAIVARFGKDLASRARVRWQVGGGLDRARAAALAACPWRQ